MATQSSILAWRIPRTEQPGELQLHRVTKSQTRLKRLTTAWQDFHSGFLMPRYPLSDYVCPGEMALVEPLGRQESVDPFKGLSWPQQSCLQSL